MTTSNGTKYYVEINARIKGKPAVWISTSQGNYVSDAMLFDYGAFTRGNIAVSIMSKSNYSSRSEDCVRHHESKNKRKRKFDESYSGQRKKRRLADELANLTISPKRVCYVPTTSLS